MSSSSEDPPVTLPRAMGNDHVVDVPALVARLYEWTSLTPTDTPVPQAVSPSVESRFSHLVQQVSDLLPRVAAAGLRQPLNGYSRYKEMPATNMTDHPGLVLVHPLEVRAVQHESQRLAEAIGELSQDLSELEGYLADVGARLPGGDQAPLQTDTPSDYPDRRTNLPSDDNEVLPW